ncbi:hypothetical protein J4E08_01145 [Sagittula sp. NFXS13]|nr:hypothetical protein [Sagittula marina]
MIAITRPNGRSSARRRDVTPFGKLVLRYVLMAVGFALTMSAFGIWIVGNAEGSSDMMLMKLGVSLFMLIIGMCLIVVAKETR